MIAGLGTETLYQHLSLPMTPWQPKPEQLRIWKLTVKTSEVGRRGKAEGRYTLRWASFWSY